MKTKLFRRKLFTGVIVFIIVANFIFTCSPIGGYCLNAFASNSLRAGAAKDARYGGTNIPPRIKVIAQDINIYGDEKVSYAQTGKIGIQQIHEAGATGSMIGHPESGDSPSTVNRKLLALIKNDLFDNPVAFGESWEDCTLGVEHVKEVINTYLAQIFEGVSGDQMSGLVLEYVPKWGTRGSGRADVEPPQPDYVQSIVKSVRDFIRVRYGDIVAEQIRIAYGGSSTPERAKQFMMEEDIDGIALGSAGTRIDWINDIGKSVVNAAKLKKRRPVLIFNWKAYTLQQSLEEVMQTISGFPTKLIDIYVAPAFTHIYRVKQLVAVMEGSTLGEMKWEMVKQSPSTLYFNNNLALTGIEARSTSLSTGHPTVEARFILKSRGGREIIITGEAASGASAGNREAIFLFDKDFAKKAEKQPAMLTDAMIEDIYGKGVDRKEALRRLKANNEGKGVEITLWIARNVLIPELTKVIKEGKIDPAKRYSIDGFIREYEKTHGGNERQKLKLTGANTTAFSTAAAKLGAEFNNMAPWEFLAYRPAPKSLKINYESFEVLIPIAVLIEGGEHGHWNTDWQEYMVEVRGDSFEEITQKLKNITFALDKIMQKRGDKIGVGLEAGYLPTVKSNTEPIEMIVQAGRDAGYTPGKDFAIALDCASSEFYREYKGKYYYWYSVEGKNNEQVTLSSGKKIGKIEDIQEEGKERAARFLLLTSQEQLEWAIDICKNPNYFISSVEDFFDQNDLWGNMMLTRTLQDKDFIASLPHEFQKTDGISCVADDISTSNMDVVRAGIDGGMVIVGSGEEAETLNFEKDTMSDILLKLNQIGTVQEVMELGEYLRSRGRTIDHSHRGKEPSKESIRADVALASTTYPSRGHDRTGAPARVKIKYGTIRKERAVVYDYLREAYATIKRKAEEAKIKTDAKNAQAKPTPEPEKPAADSIVIAEKLNALNMKVIPQQVQRYNAAEETIFEATGGKVLNDYTQNIEAKLKTMGYSLEYRKPQGVIITPDSFKIAGAKNMLSALINSFPDVKVGIGGEDAETFKILLGKEDAITGKTVEEVWGKMAKDMGIMPEYIIILRHPDDIIDKIIPIRQIVVPENIPATLAGVKIVNELYRNTTGDYIKGDFMKPLLQEFLNELTDAAIIEVPSETKEKLFVELEQEVKEGIPFEFSKAFALTKEKAQKIEQELTIIKDFLGV